MPRPANRLMGIFAVLLLGAVFSACNKSDAGVCCKVIPGGDETFIPEPEFNMEGDPRDVISQHPQFDCSGLACVSFQGSPAYCTHPCRDAADCPDGFACQPLLQSDPPDGSQLSRDDKFCVKALEACLE